MARARTATIPRFNLQEARKPLYSWRAVLSPSEIRIITYYIRVSPALVSLSVLQLHTHTHARTHTQTELCAFRLAGLPTFTLYSGTFLFFVSSRYITRARERKKKEILRPRKCWCLTRDARIANLLSGELAQREMETWLARGNEFEISTFRDNFAFENLTIIPPTKY